MVSVGVGGAACAAQSVCFAFGVGVVTTGLGAGGFGFLLVNRLRLMRRSCPICCSRLVRDWRNGDDDVEDQWADHYSNSLNWYISEHYRGR